MTDWDEIRALCPRLYRNGIYFECGLGWAKIILELSLKLEKLLTVDPDLEDTYAQQVKEKHGTLRVYISHENEKAIDLIRETEALSSQTCEICGQPAKMRGHCWLSVRCDSCYKSLSSGGKEL